MTFSISTKQQAESNTCWYRMWVMQNLRAPTVKNDKFHEWIEKKNGSYELGHAPMTCALLCDFLKKRLSCLAYCDLPEMTRIYHITKLAHRFTFD